MPPGKLIAVDNITYESFVRIRKELEAELNAPISDNVVVVALLEKWYQGCPVNKKPKNVSTR